jgi:hypothetical protein
VKIPASCAFEGSNYHGGEALPKDCELPTYPALGRATGPEFEGLWVSCDTPNADAPEKCDLSFAGPSSEGRPRQALYIDARGYGQTFYFEGSASNARPTKCNAAFRLTRQQATDGGEDRIRGYVVGSEIPFGMVNLEPGIFEEVLDVAEGPGSAPGTYLVGNTRSTYWFKRVALPSDFTSPCQATQPPLTW